MEDTNFKSYIVAKQKTNHFEQQVMNGFAASYVPFLKEDHQILSDNLKKEYSPAKQESRSLELEDGEICEFELTELANCKAEVRNLQDGEICESELTELANCKAEVRNLQAQLALNECRLQQKKDENMNLKNSLEVQRKTNSQLEDKTKISSKIGEKLQIIIKERDLANSENTLLKEKVKSFTKLLDSKKCCENVNNKEEIEELKMNIVTMTKKHLGEIEKVIAEKNQINNSNIELEMRIKKYDSSLLEHGKLALKHQQLKEEHEKLLAQTMKINEKLVDSKIENQKLSERRKKLLITFGDEILKNKKLRKKIEDLKKENKAKRKEIKNYKSLLKENQSLESTNKQKDNFEKLPLNPDSSQVTVNEPQLNKRENKFDEILREVKLHKQF